MITVVDTGTAPATIPAQSTGNVQGGVIPGYASDPVQTTGTYNPAASYAGTTYQPKDNTRLIIGIGILLIAAAVFWYIYKKKK